MPPVRKVKPEKPAKEPVVVSGQLDKKIKKLQQTKKNDRGGVIFIKHLPHGFFEEQLKGYFEQFGKVMRLRLARSKRTGGSKGYAFVEFEYPEVAQVAAETMDNYLMFKKVVKASYIPPEKQPYNYFKTSVRKVTNKAGREIYVSSKTAALQRKVKEHNDWSDDAYQRRTSAKLIKMKKLNDKHADLGIDFSNIVVHPKKVSSNEKAEKAASDAVQKAEVASGSKKVSEKRQTPIAVVAPAKKKTKKSLETKVLLDNTMNTDSEDEDYIAIPEGHNDDDDTSSDEETYGFTKDSDVGDDDGEDDDDDGEDDEPKPKSKSSFGKSMKPSKVDRYEQLLKRKPHVGGIEKTKKNVKKPAISKVKSSMQVTAAKAIAKPLSTIKNKANVKSKAGRKLQKV